MADNVGIQTGTGATIRTDDIGGGVQAQVIKIATGADGVEDGLVSSTHPMPAKLYAADASYNTPDTAANDFADQTASLAIIEAETGTISGDTTSIDGKTPALGVANEAGSSPIVHASTVAWVKGVDTGIETAAPSVGDLLLSHGGASGGISTGFATFTSDILGATNWPDNDVWIRKPMLGYGESQTLIYNNTNEAASITLYGTLDDSDNVHDEGVLELVATQSIPAGQGVLFSGAAVTSPGLNYTINTSFVVPVPVWAYIYEIRFPVSLPASGYVDIYTMRR